MNKLVFLFCAALLLCSGTVAYAQNGTMTEEAKIEYLLEFVNKAPEGTQFIRNGSAYSAERAASHLRGKYARGKSHAPTAELFIENLASHSSLSGKDYHIRFPDGRTVTAREFFTDALKGLE